MELFSEIYSCYYTVLARILEKGRYGITKQEMESVIEENAFYESAFYILPRLLSGEWNLLEEKDGFYYSKLQSDSFKRPITCLEKAWLKAILFDNKIQLFLDKEKIDSLKALLSDIEPLYLNSDFHYYDVAADKDPYTDKEYIRQFRLILEACKNRQPLFILYKGGKGTNLNERILPWKLNYSSKDDKFRLLGAIIRKDGTLNKIILNLSRIVSAEPAKISINDDYAELTRLFEQPMQSEPIIMEIYNKRNAIERAMLQFATWDKQTEYNEETNSYLCRLYFDKNDETEILIRVLSFGPAIKVLSPASFLEQIKYRIKKQGELNHGDNF